MAVVDDVDARIAYAHRANDAGKLDDVAKQEAACYHVSCSEDETNSGYHFHQRPQIEEKALGLDDDAPSRRVYRHLVVGEASLVRVLHIGLVPPEVCTVVAVDIQEHVVAAWGALVLNLDSNCILFFAIQYLSCRQSQLWLKSRP